jgi:hypothetical protein
MPVPNDPDDNDDLDPCGPEVNFADPQYVTDDGEQVDALVMFADVFGDGAAVAQRAADLRELDA